MDEKLTSGNKGVSRGKVRIFMRRWRGSWGWIGDAMIREWLDELWGCGGVRTKDRGFRRYLYLYRLEEGIQVV